MKPINKNETYIYNIIIAFFIYSNLLRGFIELYQIDHNKTYLTDFQKSLDYAWHHARDERGLFQTDWSGTDKNEKKWLLTQAAFIEMYGRLGGIDL